ncbi:MAG TPA: hypothetical protein VH817_07620 [Thermoleophilaceae bacterium]
MRTVWAKLTLLAVLGLAATPAVAARPFSFSFLIHPTDQLGVPGYVSGTTVTPEGSLYTGWAELVFRYGRRLRFTSAPVRELLDGRFPVVRYTQRSGDVRYTVTAFSAEVGKRPVNFVRVLLHNVSGRPRAANWAAALRHSGGALKADGSRAFRFPRPAQPAREGLYTQPGVSFDPDSVWAFAGDTVTRDGDTLLVFPPAPSGLIRQLSLRPAGSAQPVRENTLFGQARYHGPLPGHATRAIDFAMPVVPVDPDDSDDLAAIEDTGYDAQLAATVRFWKGIYGDAIQLKVPERKVEDTFYTSLANMDMPRYPAADGGWVQAVNKLQYNSFWLRDAAIIANSFDLAGLHYLAAQDLQFFPYWQQDDGLFISRAGQYDGLGEALWAIGQHALRTHDRSFAADMLGPVRRAMDWFEHERATEPLGLMPVGDPKDNELTTGHITGDDFWAAYGVQSAIALASLAGRDDLAQGWTTDLGAFVTDLRARLAHAESLTGGWIPPALEANGGEDWGNLWAAYPEPTVLAPGDPAVSATLRHARAHFREGIATYFHGRLLHDYLGFRVFETELLRGEQANVVDGLYSELAHTTNTNGGFETGVRRRGRREIDENLAPHGWFAAEYVDLLRNMLVRERGTNLVLMSAVSPTWLLPGRHIAVRGADTTRGHIDFTLRSIHGGALLHWNAQLFAGTKLVWPVPAGTRDVLAPGLTPDGRNIVLPAAAGRLRVHWRLIGPFPTYRGTVRRVMAAYRRG